MKKLFTIALSFVMLMLFAACGKDKVNSRPESYYVQTDSCHVMEYYGVNVFGTILLEEYDEDDIEAGFFLSTKSSFDGAEPVQWQNLYQGSFMSVILGLKPDTKYYYRAYVRQQGKYHYGKTLTFTTEPAPLHYVFEVQLSPNTADLILGVMGKTSVKLTAKVLPEDAVDNTGVFWKSSDPSVATVSNGLVSAVAPGTAIITATAGEGSYSDKCVVTVKNPIPEGAVDLGLKVYWSAKNLGASSQSDAGYRFAWGETAQKQSFPASTYKYFDANETPTKYTGSHGHEGGSADNLLRLLPEDDAAHAALGGTWRIPSWEDFAELLDNCTMSVYPADNPAGIKFTSKKNGNSILLPYNSFISGTNEYTSKKIYLWTNEVEEYQNEKTKKYMYSNAYLFTLDVIGGVFTVDKGYVKRYSGVCIRPVCD